MAEESSKQDFRFTLEEFSGVFGDSITVILRHRAVPPI